MSVIVRGKTIIRGGTTGNGPNPIVTNGLVLHLDSANNTSYPGSGNSWNDLTQYQSNATLVNSPIYSSDVAGNLYFSGSVGSNDRADFTASLGGSTLITVETWCNVVSTATFNFMFSWANGSGGYQIFLYAGVGWGYNTGAGDVYGISQADVNNLNLIGNWAHYVFVMRGDNTAYGTTNKIYINGNKQSISQQVGTPFLSNINFGAGNGYIAVFSNPTTYLSNTKVSVFKIYNRELTQSEITQNYNSLKGRFGL